MRFNSYLYLVALLAVVVVLWQLPVRWRRAWLLATSYAFYASWNVWFLALLIGVGALNHQGAFWIARGEDRRRRARWLITANVVLLALFKYLDWLCGNINLVAAVSGLPFELPLPHWALPLGISFYVFESISYIVDVMRARQKPRSFVDLQLFVAFFPKLMAGPILRGREFFHQLDLKHAPDAEALQYALRQIAFGLFLKVVLVDRAMFGLADNVNDAFARPYQQATALDAWIMSLAFSLQLYFDYSAYTRIAQGSAKLCGITLVENFDHPFISTSPAEFWQRWNISLSRWVRDYLFVPLQGGLESASKLRSAWAATVSMIVFGVWHGAGWNFVLWGAYNGAILTGYYLLVPKSGPKTTATAPERTVIWRKLAGWAVTIGLFCLGALLWRCRDITAALELFGRALMPWRYPGLNLRQVFVALIGVQVVYVLAAALFDHALRRYRERGSGYGRYAFAVLEGVTLGCLLITSLIHLQNRRAFVYFQF